MNCVCHDVPQLWHTSSRHKAGGFWVCAVKHRERERARYDNDHIYRISKNLKNNARDRRATIERRRIAHVSNREGD